MGRIARPTKDEIRERRRLIAEKAAAGQLIFPDSLKEIRLALGKSQQEFGRLLRMSRRQISELERGVANPTYETIMLIGRLFGFRLAFVSVPFDDTLAAGPVRPSFPRRRAIRNKRNDPGAFASGV